MSSFPLGLAHVKHIPEARSNIRAIEHKNVNFIIANAAILKVQHFASLAYKS